jgi:hypothetical protein
MMMTLVYKQLQASGQEWLQHARRIIVLGSKTFNEQMTLIL